MRVPGGKEIGVGGFSGATGSARTATAAWVRRKRACTIIDIGMTKLYELMKDGHIVSKRVDGIRLINLAWLWQIGD